MTDTPKPVDARFSTLLPAYDMIIIGGGINGCGIARDAAERGFQVLLVEKTDFGAGTSAASSRLIHGGLRYLAHLEFGLVRESLQERERLLRNAPHLVRPLAMAVPFYRHAKNPPWLIRMGLLLYDSFAHSKMLPRHRTYSKQALLQRYPGLNSQDLTGGAVYCDAQVALPERLCLENAIAAQETGRATLLTHTHVTQIHVENNASTGVTVVSELSGQSTSVRGQVIINASGPWVDDVLTHSEKPLLNRPRLIGGTKGSHIVVRTFPGGPDTALYIEAQSDGRPFFILPWLGAYYLIGTTDDRFEGNPDDVTTEQREVDYLLQETNHILPDAQLRREDVLYTYVGVRPLPYTPSGNAGAITRRHLTWNHANDSTQPIERLLSVVGGKLTTYRSLAEEVVDTVETSAWISSITQTQTACHTQNQPLPGGNGIDTLERYKQTHCPTASCQYQVDEALVAALIDQYGSRYERVLQLTLETPEWKDFLHPGCLTIGAQVIYAIRSEMAYTLSDVLQRRLTCGLEGDRGAGAVEAVAHLMAQELGWNVATTQQEIEQYRQHLHGSQITTHV